VSNKEIGAVDSKGKTLGVPIDKHPDTCPLCHKGIVPKYLMGYLGDEKKVYTEGPDREAQIVYQCPRNECSQIFIVYYTHYQYRPSTGRRDEQFRYDGAAPYLFEEERFSEEVNSVSELFEKIYNQAFWAEKRKLTHIAGPGYRKALEFLVKDYLCHLHPEKCDTVKKTALGSLINDWVKDPNIKTCAERATWIGNDETHYLRIYENADLQDLRDLISLTVNWVHNSILTDKFTKRIEKKKS